MYGGGYTNPGHSYEDNGCIDWFCPPDFQEFPNLSFAWKYSKTVTSYIGRRGLNYIKTKYMNTINLHMTIYINYKIIHSTDQTRSN